MWHGLSDYWNQPPPRPLPSAPVESGSLEAVVEMRRRMMDFYKRRLPVYWGWVPEPGETESQGQENKENQAART